MEQSTNPDAQCAPPHPKALFPLVRHLSVHVTPLLARTPISANQVTTASMFFGLACAWMMLSGDWAMGVAGGIMLVLCYIFDNCDGEIARIKNQCSYFGMRYDSFVDFIVHFSFFACLGIGVSQTTGQEMWLWMGWTAAAGAAINYFLGFFIDARDRKKQEQAEGYDPTGRTAVEVSKMPETWYEWAVFFFRELTRADFCFIVIGLTLFDMTWVLLPAGAIGAQVYWATAFIRGASEFHV